MHRIRVVMYKVSVIVPVYNGESFLSNILSCLVRQTLGSSLQIILIDDGSVDTSYEIMQAYEKQYNNIICVHTDNYGAAHARNTGLKYAEGEYIGFADCDDYLDLAMYEKLYEKAVEEEADIATCGYLRVDGFDIQKRDYVNRRCFGYSLYQAPSLLRRNVPYNVTKLISRRLIESEGLRYDDDLRIYEDLLFSYKAFLKANKIVKVPETLYVYNYSREGSLTFEFSNKRFDLFPAFQRLIDFYKSNDAFVMAEDELLNIFLLHMYVVLDGRCNRKTENGHGPIDFFKRCLAFLNTNFPWWQGYDVFFKRTKRPQLLYTNALYLSLRLRRPSAMMARDRRRALAKREQAKIRAGVRYIAQYDKSVERFRVLIDSQRGENLSGNMFYLLRELLCNSKYSHMDIGLTYKKPAHRRKFIELLEATGWDYDNVSLIKYNGQHYAMYLATAKYIFTDTSMPVHFIKKPEQVYVNTWHGTPLKRMGRDMEKGFASISNLTKNFNSADFLYFQNEFMKKCMEDAYMYERGEQKTRLIGYPRNEIFFDENSRMLVRSRLADEGIREVIAYLPTWRGVSRGDGNRYDIATILSSVDERLQDDQVLYAKLHHYDAASIDFDRYNHIRPFPTDLETYEALNACDSLVTDYSSVMFDYGTTRNKIVLFTYDVEDYLSDRGLYVNLEDLPVEIASNVDELIHALRMPKDENKTEAFYRMFCMNERKNCSEQLLDEVFSKTNAFDDIRDSTCDLLVFAGNMIYPSSRDAVCGLLENIGQVGARVAFSYDASLLQNSHLLKEFDPRVRWLGVMNPYSATSDEEREVISLSASDPSLLQHYQSMLDKLVLREKRRTFPGIRFGASLIYGNDSIMNMLLATRCADASFLVVDDISYYSQVPCWILERFDRIVCLDGTEKGKLFCERFANAEIRKEVSLRDFV